MPIDDDALHRTDTSPYSAPHVFPPPSATVQVAFGAASERGSRHAVNEDHYLVLRLTRSQDTLLTSLSVEGMGERFDEYGYAMVVADGMGNTGAGEVASHLAIGTLVHLVRHFGKWNLRVDDTIAREIMARAERFYRHVDSAVVHQRQRGAVRTDQTTLTATFSAGRDLFFAHVGHSRAYLARGGQLLRLTRDHTLDQQHAKGVPVGPLIDVNATARDLRHILTDTIGMSGAVGPTIDIERLRLEDDDVVVVCTNGVTDALREERLLAILTADDPPSAQAQTLVDEAMAAGGGDDATALVARYRIPANG